MQRARLLTRFSSRDNAESVTFPPGVYEWESSQGYRTAYAEVIGAGYAVDLLGHGQAPVETASERISSTAVATDGPAIDALLERLRAITYDSGLGKLWSSDALGDERWAWARLASRPSATMSFERRNYAPVVCEFTRLSPWFAATATVDVETVTTTTHNFTVSNLGNAQIDVITVTLVGTFSNPKLTNLTTGEWVQINRSGVSANDVVRLIANEFRAEYSTDGGASWLSAYPNLVLGPTQVGLLRLIRGTNSLQLINGAVPNATLTLTYSQTYQ